MKSKTHQSKNNTKSNTPFFAGSGSQENSFFKPAIQRRKKEKQDKEGNPSPKTHTYYFDKDYQSSPKHTLKDKANSYYIPLPSRKEENVEGKGNEYHYLDGKSGKRELGRMTIPDGYSEEYMVNAAKKMHKGEMIGYDVFTSKVGIKYLIPYGYATKTYIKINSPMTIKGGDVNDQQGFVDKKDCPISPPAAKAVVDKWVAKVGYDRTKPLYAKVGLKFTKNKPFIKPTTDSASKLKAASGYNKPLDFRHNFGLKPETIYKINDTYYNANEAGNYWYGYALAYLGNISEADLEFIAHEGTRMLSKDKRSYDEPWELAACLTGFYDCGINLLGKETMDNEGMRDNGAYVDMYNSPFAPK